MSHRWWADRLTWAWVVSVAIGVLALLVEPGVLVGVGVPEHLAATYQARVALAIAVLGVVLAALRRGSDRARYAAWGAEGWEG